uniref:Uncharacterized protein n=1 Tax=Sphaerodactylus townsendi TaxID=933632 RepID=A0ACB8G7Q0_9SAUR
MESAAIYEAPKPSEEREAAWKICRIDKCACSISFPGTEVKKRGLQEGIAGMTHFSLFSPFVREKHASRDTREPALGHPESKPSTKSNMLRGRTSATSADEQPHIGNYRLLKTIGKGNFAKVKLARHVLTGKEFSSHVVFLNVGVSVPGCSLCNGQSSIPPIVCRQKSFKDTTYRYCH